jgi:hypothetical protein
MVVHGIHRAVGAAPDWLRNLRNGPSSFAILAGKGHQTIESHPVEYGLRQALGAYRLLFEMLNCHIRTS